MPTPTQIAQQNAWASSSQPDALQRVKEQLKIDPEQLRIQSKKSGDQDELVGCRVHVGRHCSEVLKISVSGWRRQVASHSVRPSR